MAVYGFALFSGAFLLFQAQPLIGKYILPWFGGAPAVWTTCLVVFQGLLLAGYAYAYFSTRWLKPRTQVVVHLALLGAAIITLPITPDSSWKPHTTNDPTLRICAILTVSLGLPFFALSATAPLLQYWLSLTHAGTSPYRLYALSNAGSLLALLSYPSVVETCFTRATQTLLWSAGLGVYGLSCGWAGLMVWRAAPRLRSASPPAKVPGPVLGDKMLWLLLPACASLLLVATTNKLCQDLAPIALLWILPLAFYLLSFILCFNTPKYYDRRWFAPLLFLSLAAMGLTLSGFFALSAQVQLLVFLAGLLVCCIACHGEVYRVKPHPGQLTLFYLIIGAGGALGGAFVAVIAPRIFSDYFELHWGLLLCGGLFLFAWSREQSDKFRLPWPGGACFGGVAALGWLAFVLWGGAHRNDQMRVYRSRNFYGVLGVYRHDSPDPAESLMELVHGRVAHGVQFLQPNRAQTPTLYYTTDSGVGRALAINPQGQRRIGVVGLGAGTMAAYARPGDQICFYEINPEVEKIAKTFFTFLQSCAGQVEVVLGDARLSLEHEPAQNYDLLALDAFNSDAIPIHLLTREAFASYQRHLKTNAVVAVHVSNLSLNLEPVVFNLAREFGYTAETVEQRVSNEMQGVLPSTWILLFRDPSFTNAFAIRAAGRGPAPSAFKVPLWTDDFNGVFAELRWWEHPRASAVPNTAYSEPAPAHAKRAGLASAIERFRAEVARDPNSSVALNNLACLLATAPNPDLRNGPEAVRLAEKACALTEYRNTSTISTLAAAYAEAGRFEEAVAMAEKACAMAAEKGESGLLAGNRQMLQYYRRNRPYHQANP